MPGQSEPKGERTASSVPRTMKQFRNPGASGSQACAVLCDGWAVLRCLLTSSAHAQQQAERHRRASAEHHDMCRVGKEVGVGRERAASNELQADPEAEHHGGRSPRAREWLKLCREMRAVVVTECKSERDARDGPVLRDGVGSDEVQCARATPTDSSKLYAIEEPALSIMSCAVWAKVSAESVWQAMSGKPPRKPSTKTVGAQGRENG